MTRFIVLTLSALICLACMPRAAYAAINKCVGADGKVVFSDQACSTGQASTVVKAATKTAEPGKALSAGDLPAEGAATPNSTLQQYDTRCAEDSRLFAIAASKAVSPSSKENLQFTRERIDKRCNPQQRMAAAEKDVQLQALDCKLRREELQALKSRPAPGPGYASNAPEIATSEAWIRANCNALGR